MKPLGGGAVSTLARGVLHVTGLGIASSGSPGSRPLGCLPAANFEIPYGHGTAYEGPGRVPSSTHAEAVLDT
jgi:hypothetical protein